MESKCRRFTANISAIVFNIQCCIIRRMIVRRKRTLHSLQLFFFCSDWENCIDISISLYALMQWQERRNLCRLRLCRGGVRKDNFLTVPRRPINKNRSLYPLILTTGNLLRVHMENPLKSSMKYLTFKISPTTPNENE